MAKKFLIRGNHPYDPTAEYPFNFLSKLESLNSNPKLSKNREISSQWANSDTEENYIKTTEMGVVHTYKADDFYYDLNKHGFRCDNFDTMKSGLKSVIASLSKSMNSFKPGATLIVKELVECAILRR